MKRIATALAAAVAAAALLAPSAAAPSYTPEGSYCLLKYATRGKGDAQRCMSCHDGSAASAKTIGHGAFSGSHSVDVIYGDEAARFARLRPAGQLPGPIVLSGGKVTCTSCHDGRSSLPGRIAMNMDQLCTGCHLL